MVYKRISTSRMIKPTIVCGIELELEFNPARIDIGASSYHSNTPYAFSKSFSAETDGSLSSSAFVRGKTVELVSKPFVLKDYKKILKEFKETICAKSGTNTMSEVINFNHTTGAHLHISVLNQKLGINKTFTIRDRRKTFTLKNSSDVLIKLMSEKKLKSINSMLLRRVKKELPHVYTKFKKRFYRIMAKDKIDRFGRDRYSSWNFQTNSISHLEFRSFHLYGVETWEDFFKMYDILFSVIEHKFKQYIKKRLADSVKVDVSDDVARSVNQEFEYDVVVRPIDTEIHLEVV